RYQRWVATGQDHHTRAQFELARPPGGDGQADQRVGRRTSEAFGEPQRVETQALEDVDQGGEGLGLERRARAQAEADADFHVAAGVMLQPRRSPGERPGRAGRCSPCTPAARWPTRGLPAAWPW